MCAQQVNPPGTSVQVHSVATVSVATSIATLVELNRAVLLAEHAGGVLSDSGDGLKVPSVFRESKAAQAKARAMQADIRIVMTINTDGVRARARACAYVLPSLTSSGTHPGCV